MCVIRYINTGHFILTYIRMRRDCRVYTCFVYYIVSNRPLESHVKINMLKISLRIFLVKMRELLCLLNLYVYILFIKKIDRYPDFDEINAEKITPTFPVNFGESRLQFSQARYDSFFNLSMDRRHRSSILTR